MEDRVTFEYGGVGFVALVSWPEEDWTDWIIDEIRVDVSSWPFKHGLYDLLDMNTIDAAHRAVAEAMPEIIQERRLLSAKTDR